MGLFSLASNSARDATSIWRAVSPARAPAVPLRGQCDTEVAIVGGGFTGLSTALHLARRGRKVVLLEGRDIGWGGSGRNNGQVIPVLSAAEPAAIEARFGEAGERLVGLIRDSASCLFDLARREGIDCEAEQTGWFQPAHSPAHVRVSAARVAAWSQRGAPCELLDRAACAALLGSNRWHGGMLNPTGGHINPLMLARGLAAACETAGVVIHEGTPATGVARANGRWCVSAHGGAVIADAVLVATNAYSNELTRSLVPDVARSIVPVTSWQMASEPVEAALRGHILPGRQAVSDTRGDLRFFRYDARHRLIAGAAMLVPLNARTRVPGLVARRMREAFPDLGRLTFSHVWSGYVGVTPDHFPHFHELDPGCYAAIGYNGRGVALSVSMGRELAAAIDGEDRRDLALPLSPVRPIPFHPIARRIARSALVYYRWRDRRPPGT